MRLNQFCSLLIWIAVGLNLATAEVSSADTSTGCDENVLSQMVNMLNEINKSLNAIQLQNANLNTELQNLQNIKSTMSTSDAGFSCATALEIFGKSGVYNLTIPGTGLAPFNAYCLADPRGGSAWTVIQRRQDGSVSFNRTWYDYKYGFGDFNGEYWLGLERIYAMTSNKEHELWIELGDHEGQNRHARYAAFEIGNEKEYYYLKTLEGFTGNAGNALGNASIYNKFTTFDEDTDQDKEHNCALDSHGGWWFTHCNHISLNGEYNNNNWHEGINWYSWHGSEYSLKYAHMAIRPAK